MSFSDEVRPLRRPAHNAETVGRPSGANAGAHEPLNLAANLLAAGETTYTWNFADDCMTWLQGTHRLLDVADVISLERGAQYQMLVEPDRAAARYSAIVDELQARERNHKARCEGVPYRLVYRLCPHGRRADKSVWVEDQGRTFLDAIGRPQHALGVIRLIGDRMKELDELKHAAMFDELSGVYNRRQLALRLTRAIEETEQTGKPLCFLVAGIDNLALTNETFGFDIGDQILKTVAQRLFRHARSGDTVGNFSANKFGIVVRDCNASSMRIASERFLSAIASQPVETSVGALPVTISIGGVQVPSQARDTSETFAAGLQALEQSRGERSNGFYSYAQDKSVRSSRSRNVQVVDQVISAVKERRMQIALQPIVDGHSKEPVFYEALLRMINPQGEVVSAGAFMPLAEQLGLSRMIDRHVLELGVEVLKSRPDIRVSVNVSGSTATDHEWVLEVDRLTGGRKDITNRLVVEITETVAIQDIDQSINFVDMLKDLGCKVAIDDFGAGYTSFQNLKYLGVDMVKIDGSFIEGLSKSPGDLIFVEKLAELATHFNIETVAEWVDDDETAAMLNRVGIHYFQGFRFGEPVLFGDDWTGRPVISAKLPASA